MAGEEVAVSGSKMWYSYVVLWLQVPCSTELCVTEHHTHSATGQLVHSLASLWILDRLVSGKRLCEVS